MQTIKLARPPSALKSGIQLLLARKPSTGRVNSLAPVSYRLPCVTLDSGHLERYRQVCGFSAAQGVPLIYPQLLTAPLVLQWFISPECPWPALGTVHLANQIEQYAALQCGDQLRVEVASGELIAHPKGQVFTLVQRIYRDQALVWEATQSLLRVGVREPCGAAYRSALGADAMLSQCAEFDAPTAIGRRYGVVSGDLNPIHLTALSAKLFGFKRAIAHGMWTKARALALLLPQQPVDVATASVEFKRPLLLPGRATLWSSDSGDFELRDSAGQTPHLRGRLRLG